MSLSLNLKYQNPSDFVFDSSKIQVSGGAASLILNPLAQTFNPTFGSSVGFTFDSTRTEFVGGAVRQKDTRPATATFYADWTSQLNASWVSSGSTTVNANGGAAISGGLLNLVGTGKYVTINDTGALPVQVGTIAFNWKPNYSGNPSQEQTFFSYGEVINGSKSLTSLYHETNGNIYLQLYSTTSGLIFDGNIAVFSPVAGTSYTVVIQIDTTTGATKVFINGVQLGSTVTGTGTRGGMGWWNVGTIRTLTSTGQNFSISGLAVYSTIVGPTNLTPLYTTHYVADTVTIPIQTYAGLAHILSYDSFSTTDVNAPHYTVNGKYWNTTAWFISDGSYAQSNTAAVINTNLSSLSPSDTVSLQSIWQASDTLQMSLSALTFGYTGQAYPTSNPTIQPIVALTADGTLTNFIETSVISGTDAIKWILQISGIKYYWTGSAWATSDGTYAQSSLSSDIVAHIGTFPVVTAGALIVPIAFLHSNSGLTTSQLSQLELDFTFNPASVVTPNECIVFGSLEDIIGSALGPTAKAMLIVTNPVGYFYGKVFIGAGTSQFSADSNGYVQVSLVEGDTYAKPYDFSISYQDATGKAQLYKIGSKTVPNSVFLDLSVLASS